MEAHEDDEVDTAERALVPMSAPVQVRTPALLVVAGTDLGRVYTIGTALVVGRGDDVNIAVLDPKVSRRHAIVRVRQRVAWIEDLGSKNGTYVNGVLVDKRILEAGDRIELGSTRSALRYDVLDPAELDLCGRLYASSTLDELTGTFNRRYAEQRLHAEAAYAARHGAKLALVVLELEGYERILDRHGAGAAERALVHVAQHVRRRLRPEYALARYRDAGFALVCPGISSAEADALHQSIVDALGQHPLELPAGPERIELRIGTAHAEGGSNDLAAVLVARAHEALAAV